MPPRIPEHLLTRKGARTTRDVPAEVRELLNAGRLETVNLSEWLIVDQRRLAETVLAEAGWQQHWPRLRAQLDANSKPTAPSRVAAIGQALATCLAGRREFRAGYTRLRAHPSDVVRSWCCYLVGRREELTLAEALELVRPLAADANMGVRETSWMAVRERIAAELDAALLLLSDWITDKDPAVRRFASEATRPRGVWCRHIERLKREPQMGLPLLEPLRADPARYVQDSVANWLNDASKSCPRWVRQVTARWRRESRVPATERICKRALRTIHKADRT